MDSKIIKFIDDSEPIVIELETALTGIPALSPDSGGNGELEKCVWLERWLFSQNITDLKRIDIPDERANKKIRPNLIATIPGKDDSLPRLWIMSHLDVVPPGEKKLWNSDPWKLVQKDGKVFGRGVEDNQQGLVSSVIAALAFVKTGLQPQRTVKLLFVADEECGSEFGIIPLIEKDKRSDPSLFRKTDMMLVPDGGDSEGATIEIAEKNIMWIKFITNGKQAHASMPDKGVNAFLAACDLAVSLHKNLSLKFNGKDALFDPDYSTFQPTKKDANVPNVNTIPGEDVFYMDMRILPCYPTKIVIEEIDRIIKDVSAANKVEINYEVLQNSQSSPTPPDAPVVKHLSKVIKEVLKIEPRLIGIGGGTVAAPLRNAGLNAVVWSPLDDCAHQPNEYALIKNIINSAKVMACMME
jgi:succinyl-diaminopimelate desuccinylase